MSTETRNWLSHNTLIGFTSKRRKAWHWRAGDDNHFDMEVPMDRVEKLFGFKVVERPLYYGTPGETTLIPDRKAMVHEHTGDVLGVFKSGFQGHDYMEWLVNNVSILLDADLKLASAGLLKKGAVGWVQVEMEETMTTPEGVDFRPFLTAYTSFDGSFATTYKNGITRVECDNTLAAAVSEGTEQTVKYRHSSNSLNKIGDARKALEIVFDVKDDFEAQVKELCAQEVSDAQFRDIMELEFPDRDTKAGLTKQIGRREVVEALYRQDERVEPYKGTAFGVYQAMNTYRQHVAPLQKRTERAERNQLNFLRSIVEKDDNETMKHIDLVLAAG